MPADQDELIARLQRAEADVRQLQEHRSWADAEIARLRGVVRMYEEAQPSLLAPAAPNDTAFEMMPPATHVLWNGCVLCEDLRLRGVPGDWLAGHRWISLKDVADGAVAPPDHCKACWTKAPARIEELRQIGRPV